VESTADAKENSKAPASSAQEMTAAELKAKLKKFHIA